MISASTSVFLNSTGSLIKAIFTSFTTLGILGCTRSLSMTMPSISSESSTLPPTFLSILMLSISTTFLPPSSSTTDFTALTTSFDNLSLELSAPLPVIAVSDIFNSRSSSSSVTVLSMVFSISDALSAASLYPLAIIVECTSWSSRSSATFRSSPASTAAVVVPSPTSSSWVLATSTTILAAGCSISISLKIVTPSLVITTSPRPSTSILSMPFGPRVVLTALATALAAIMLLFWASLPLERSVPSLNINIGCPPNCAAII